MMKLIFVVGSFLISTAALADHTGWVCKSTLFNGYDGDEVIGDTYTAAGCDRDVVQQDAMMKCQAFVETADDHCVPNGCEPAHDGDCH